MTDKLLNKAKEHQRERDTQADYYWKMHYGYAVDKALRTAKHIFGDDVEVEVIGPTSINIERGYWDYPYHDVHMVGDPDREGPPILLKIEGRNFICHWYWDNSWSQSRTLLVYPLKKFISHRNKKGWPRRATPFYSYD